MEPRPDDLSTSQALVIDSHATSRSILVAQLREFGLGKVVQCVNTTTARKLLEQERFDVVLCEHAFESRGFSGQDLVDDLRRNQLLPFSTVFIMVTAEATYAKVADAAESALDGYLLKPHSANSLGERLYQARTRKLSLREIFEAIDNGNFDQAARLCLQRFAAKGPFWLYAARMGADLLLRTGQFEGALTLLNAVIAAKPMLWARLGIARTLLESGQAAKAASALEKLLAEQPDYADAFDMLGRAQFELGKYPQALEAYQSAAQLSPHSITRAQNFGLLMAYVGDRKQAELLLERTVRMGLDSKMLDCQALVLLAFLRLESSDKKALLRCQDEFKRVAARSTDTVRTERHATTIAALVLVQEQQYAAAVEVVKTLARQLSAPEFDFEAATNLLALACALAQRKVFIDQIEATIDTLGMRFCTTRPLSELLITSAAAHPAHAERIRACNTQITKITESAISLSLHGDPRGAVDNLLAHGQTTLNARLIDTAYLVLQRYGSTMDSHSMDGGADLQARVQDLRTRFAPAHGRSVLGEPQRPAGALMLRTGGGSKARALPGWQPAEPPVPRHAFLPPGLLPSDPP